MKRLLLSLCLFLSCGGFLQAQKKLTASATSGKYTYIYKLTDKETLALPLIDDSYMHTLIDSATSENLEARREKLPFGNYLLVSAKYGKLEYEMLPVSNVHFRPISNGKDFQGLVTDLKGSPVSNADVWVGNRKVNNDPSTRLYTTKFIRKPAKVTVKYEGISSFYNYKVYKPEPKPFFLSKMFKRKPERNYEIQQSERNRYLGYLVFSKPKYKPLDTVKFKAYLITSKGNSINGKSMRIELNGIVLDTLQPYREGGYESQVILQDSLKLELDRNYALVLREKVGGKWVKAFSQEFKYEDYELKQLSLSVRMDKNEASRNNPATIYLKATDENGLSVPDGRTVLIVTTGYVSRYYADKVFVKDTLWKTTLVMDPVGETKLVLPDSIFPNADLQANLNFNFLNSNNENLSTYKSLQFRHVDQRLKSEIKGDSLRLDYLKNNISITQTATVFTVYADEYEVKDSIKLRLPASIPINPMVQNYRVQTEDGFSNVVYMQQLQQRIIPYAEQGKDSLHIMVENKNKTAFWYSIFSGDEILKRGYTRKLDTVMKHTVSRTAHIELKYVWAGMMQTEEVSAYYNDNNLKVSMEGPEVVYPGQTVNIAVKVTDINDKPVSATDVTAFAATSKFSGGPEVYLPVFGNRFIGRKLKAFVNDRNILTEASGELRLNWEKWGRKLGLDTIEYYKFTQTKDLYRIDEDCRDSMALIAPFLMKDGAIEPIHIVYIDDIPVYFSQADQLQRYAFRVDPGMHQITLRSANHQVTIADQNFLKGKKTVISVAADLLNKKAKVSTAQPSLSAEEADQVSNYMIRIENSFQGQKAILLAEKSETLLSPPADYNNKQSLLIGPYKENILYLTTPHVHHAFVKEPGYTYTFLPNLIRQKSFPEKYGFDIRLGRNNPLRAQDYRDIPLTRAAIDSIWTDHLDRRSMTTTLFNNLLSFAGPGGAITSSVTFSKAEKAVPVKNMLIYRSDQPDLVYVFPGSAGLRPRVAEGTYSIMYLFKNNSYFIKHDAIVRRNGTNYYHMKDPGLNEPDSMSVEIDRWIKSAGGRYLIGDADGARDEILEILNARFFNRSALKQKISGVVRDEKSLLPLGGVTVNLKGYKRISTRTDKSGTYSLTVPARSTLVFSVAGYDVKTMNVLNYKPGLLMTRREPSAGETILREYKKRAREKDVRSVSGYLAGDVPVSNVEQLLQGKVAGLNIQNNTGAPGLRGSVNIRGLSTISTTGAGTPLSGKPLVIIDGLPFSGAMESLDQTSIAEIRVLKDAEAAALYGSMGKNGVILIKTLKGNTQLNPEGSIGASENSMRKNFSDYAIWQPRLFTDLDGRASFTVKFPDDITSWSANLVAMNGRRQSGRSNTLIKSFKSLSANFVSPQFALSGDEIRVIGKLMNYTNNSESAARKFIYNGKEVKNSIVSFKNAHLDTISIVAADKATSDAGKSDSLSFEYSMLQDNGYFDGELRKIPLLQTGVTETKGYFDAFIRDTTVSYDFDASLGKVTLHAEASVFPVLLDEIGKLSRYEYLCNEQLASKLKGLLLEKTVRKQLGQDFKQDKQVREILKKLMNSRRAEGTWGWWQNSPEEMWISLHVVEALLQAEKQGYSIQLDKERLYRYLTDQLAGKKGQNEIYAIKLIGTLSSTYFIKDWVEQLK
ncbi:MAG TPA: alpha-2-macroglobulin family protein, partial [Pedobacter sp.]|uniref:alpha-2-macroglobulin family protein n=1 Tax=Pedobacter sp. TaxID=1411316 RepID=UPI002CA6F056